MSFSCMREEVDNCHTMTRLEERQLVTWLVFSFNNRPGDWQLIGNQANDAASNITVRFASRQTVRITSPIEMRPFRLLNRWRVYRAAHAWRHRVSGRAYNCLAKAMAKSPLPAPESPALTRPKLPPEPALQWGMAAE